MKLNKLFKGLVLVCCLMLVFGLVACKEDTASDKADSSSKVSSDEPSSNDKTESTTSGIELEEDVFDDGDVDNAQSSNSSTNSSNSSNTDNISSNQSTTGTPSTPSSDNSSGDEGNDNSSEDDGIIEEDDGTVKLPVDWF